MRKTLLGILMIFGIVTTVSAGDSSLAKIKEKGYFIVGLDATFAPLGFRDEKGEIVGLDVDLAKEVAKRMGVEARFKPCEWDGILFELRGGKIDIVWNGMTITPARAKQVAFSNPYLDGRQVIFTRKEQGMFTIADLKGKRVGVQLGSSGAVAVESNPISKEIKELKKYATNIEALMDLEAKRIDAVVMAEFSGRYYNLKQNTLIYSEEDLLRGENGVAFRKEDKSFVNEVNKLLDEIKKDGTFTKLSKKWLGD